MSQILSCNKMQSCVVCRWLSCRTRPGSKKRGQESSPSTPSGDSSTASTMPGTPTPDAEPKKKPRKNPKVEEPLTAIQKGRDMANKLLKKKSDAANLALTLQAVPYGEQLHKEMENFSSAFENLGCICTCLHAWHAAWIMSFTIFYHAAGPWPALVALILGVMLWHLATCVSVPRKLYLKVHALVASGKNEDRPAMSWNLFHNEASNLFVWEVLACAVLNKLPCSSLEFEKHAMFLALFVSLYYYILAMRIY